MPVLIILLAMGLERFQASFGRTAPRVLIVIGVLCNLWGTVWFK